MRVVDQYSYHWNKASCISKPPTPQLHKCLTEHSVHDPAVRPSISTMVSESLSDALRNSARPVFLFGSVPPKDGTSIEKAKEICVNFSSKSAVLATDGFVVYDIQDETARTALERPFPFRKCMDAAQYASFFPAASGKQCIVYKSVVETKCDDFEKWLDNACLDYMHNTYNLVGCTGLDLNEVGKMMKSRNNVSFGCVCSPERHTLNQNESTYMVMKSEFGADWFTTQGIFSAAPISKLLNDYGDICRQKCLMPKKVLLTFAPCGRPKTMAFIKWLGMYVPEEKEKRILAAAVPAQESVILLNEILTNILEQTRNSGVPLGIIVESLSVYNDEVDAAHELFQLLQATMLNSRGSPWSVRWFPVSDAKLLSSSEHNDDEDGSSSIAKHLATVGLVGVVSIIVGRIAFKP